MLIKNILRYIQQLNQRLSKYTEITYKFLFNESISDKAINNSESQFLVIQEIKLSYFVLILKPFFAVPSRILPTAVYPCLALRRKSEYIFFAAFLCIGAVQRRKHGCLYAWQVKCSMPCKTYRALIKANTVFGLAKRRKWKHLQAYCRIKVLTWSFDTISYENQ